MVQDSERIDLHHGEHVKKGLAWLDKVDPGHTTEHNMVYVAVAEAYFMAASEIRKWVTRPKNWE